MTKRLITWMILILILTVAARAWTEPLELRHPQTGESGVWFPDKAVQEIYAELRYRYVLQDAYEELYDAYGELQTFTMDMLLPAYRGAVNSAALHRRQRNVAMGAGVAATLAAFIAGLLL